MKLTRIFFLFIASLVIVSCQKTLHGPLDIPAATMLNVSYGSDPLQDMDIYLPANRSTTSTKVIILIHGGGWNTGDKSDLTEYVDSLQRRMPSYAVININYRLAVSTTTLFPTQENDVKTALQFIVSNSGNYMISQKIVLVGVSAGGHLALLQGYKYSSPVRPKAIVDFFGPTDLIDMYNNPANPFVPAGLVSVTGKTPTQDSLLYANSSPLNYVSSSSPPTIILHGGTDILVKPTQSTSLQAKLQAAGVINQYVFYPTEGHGWVGANLTDSFNKIQAFLAANVN